MRVPADPGAPGITVLGAVQVGGRNVAYIESGKGPPGPLTDTSITG
jgi:hypothetical protein